MSIQQIAKDVKHIKAHLIEKVPDHFSKKHLIGAFFGAMLLGLTFMFKGLLYQISLSLTTFRLVLIVVATIIALSAEIYFIGYARVKNKTKRSFGQFWLKRISTYYFIALFVAALLVFIYGIHAFTGTWTNTFKVIISVSFPCAVGAAAADLLEKY